MLKIINILKWICSVTTNGPEDWNTRIGLTYCLQEISQKLLQKKDKYTTVKNIFTMIITGWINWENHSTIENDYSSANTDKDLELIHKILKIPM